jgi:hypothetical protein
MAGFDPKRTLALYWLVVTGVARTNQRIA